MKVSKEERDEWREGLRNLKRGADILGKPIIYEELPIIRLLDDLEEMEAALEKALNQNMAGMMDASAEMLEGLFKGLSGDNSPKVHISNIICPYCNKKSETVAEATAHDAICEKHPAVIRAKQAERERDILIDCIPVLHSNDCETCPVGHDKTLCPMPGEFINTIFCKQILAKWAKQQAGKV